MKRALLSLLLIAGAGMVVLSALHLAGAAAQPGTPLEIKSPLGLPPVPIPADNPMTVEKVELGKMLFFEKRLSKDKDISCATCHLPKHGYAEEEEVSTGHKGQKGNRNANPVINSQYATSLFWDGRAKSLEEQAGGPVENPIEMAHDMNAVTKELGGIPEYQKRFMAVFGEGPTKDNITKAIAAFERTLLEGHSPFDKFQAGDAKAISEDAQKGWELFNQKLCSTCHTPPVFSNWGFYNAGVGTDKKEPDLGRMVVTKLESDKGAFRVPSLRGVEQTGPYFHDGSAETLEEAVKFMAGGGKDNPNLHPLFQALKAQKTTEKEILQLVAFLKSLTGEYPVVEEPKLPE
ncbi:MAG: cytochrome-c peroxidase [bacterium]